ncbi:MAG: HAD family hydrolase [Hyphomicrobiaceae bacterium]
MPIRAVFFDVGETLVDEQRLYADYAMRMGVAYEFFMERIEAAMADRQPVKNVFAAVKPGFDFKAARAQREAEGKKFVIGPHDLYHDAAEALSALKARGYFIGIVGNQPVTAEAMLRGCGLAADFIATSDGWGVAKPDPAFFAKVIDAAGMDPHHIAYVGDRVDNDVMPARASGMWPILIRRGPWGRAQWNWPEASQAHHRIESLAELPALLRGPVLG